MSILEFHVSRKLLRKFFLQSFDILFKKQLSYFNKMFSCAKKMFLQIGKSIETWCHVTNREDSVYRVDFRRLNILTHDFGKMSAVHFPSNAFRSKICKESEWMLFERYTYDSCLQFSNHHLTLVMYSGKMYTLPSLFCNCGFLFGFFVVQR